MSDNETLIARCNALEAKVKQLRAIIASADDHPLALVEGGAHGVERCLRALDRLSTATYYWDNADLEAAHESIEDAIEGAAVGEVFELQPLHALPIIWVCVTKGGYSIHATEKAAWDNQQKEMEDAQMEIPWTALLDRGLDSFQPHLGKTTQRLLAWIDEHTADRCELEVTILRLQCDARMQKGRLCDALSENRRLQVSYVKRGEWIQELTKICEGLKAVVDALTDQRSRLEQIVEQDSQPGMTVYRMAEALLDALDVYKAAEAAGGE